MATYLVVNLACPISLVDIESELTLGVILDLLPKGGVLLSFGCLDSF